MSRQIQLLYLTLFLLTSESVYAQIGLGLTSGFGLPNGKQTISDGQIHVQPNGLRTLTVAEPSYGKGLYIGLEVNWRLKNNVQIYLQNEIFKGSTTRHYSSTVSISRYFEDAYRADMYSMIPGLRFNQTIKRLKAEVYMALGAQIGLWTRLRHTSKYDSPDTYSVSTLQKTKGIPIGIVTNLGLRKKIGNHFYLGIEGFAKQLSYSPKKGEVILANRDGVNILPNFTTRGRFVIYKKSYVDDGLKDPDVPTTRLKENQSFSSVGMRISVFFDF